MLYTPTRAAMTTRVESSSRPNKPSIQLHPDTESSAGQWMSTFQPSNPQDITSQDGSTSDKVELYDPYDPGSSESESEVGREQGEDRLRSHQDLGRRRSDDDGRWEKAYPQLGETHFERQDREPEPVPLGRYSLGPSNRPPPRHHSSNPDYRPRERLGYDFIREPLDHQRFSPKRHRLDSSDRLHAPASYRGPRSNGEERTTGCASKTEVCTTVRLSPPRFQLDYQLQSGYIGTGVEKVQSTPCITEDARSRSRSPVKEIENPFACELCEMELANLEDLEYHLEGKSHWDTMEHIQQHNNYDDLTIAFLQDVMMFKVRQCCHTMEEGRLEVLQESDHMTRVEMLHCAPCDAYVSTSAASVKNHLSSQKHIHNKQAFVKRQKHTCLGKAQVMINQLKPQFEQYREGGNPFE